MDNTIQKQNRDADWRKTLKNGYMGLIKGSLNRIVVLGHDTILNNIVRLPVNVSDDSTYVANAIEVFGINEKVYHQFCPMADKNKGAYWLSKEEKVINPYFGAAMLTCGEVKQIIE